MIWRGRRDPWIIQRQPSLSITTRVGDRAGAVLMRRFFRQCPRRTGILGLRVSSASAGKIGDRGRFFVRLVPGSSASLLSGPARENRGNPAGTTRVNASHPVEICPGLIYANKCFINM